MDDRVERMVEAGARAIHDLRWAVMVEATQQIPRTWDHVVQNDTFHRAYVQRVRDDARACLTAAHAEAELDGVILTRVPGSVETVFGVETIFGDDSAKGHVEGWSLCRAAVLAGQVTP